MQKKSQVKSRHNSKPVTKKNIVEENSRFKVLLTGAVIGAIGSILLAPQSGQKTREQLAKQSQWAGKMFGDLGKGIAEQAKKVADREAIYNWSDYAGTIGGGSSRGRTAMVIAGVLAAVASTLLFAPRPGKETRQWLTRQMRTGRDRFNEAVEKVQSDAQKVTQRIRDTVKVGVQSNGDMAQRMTETTGSEIYRHAR
jgi:gas vesicle protein